MPENKIKTEIKRVPVADPVRIATQSLFERYRARILARDWSGEGSNETGLPNLAFLCGVALDNIDHYPVDKLNRWLGFVVGVLTQRGMLAASAENDACRSEFQAVHEGAPALTAPLRAATRTLFQRYLNLIDAADWRDEPSDEGSLPLLSILCRIAIAEADSGPIHELSRWLGFVQGCLAVKGLIAVDAERDFSRPFFHQAYKLMGTAIPPSRDLSAA